MQCQRHGPHASRAGDPGDGQTPVHCGSALRVPDWGEALPHTGVSEWYGIRVFFFLFSTLLEIKDKPLINSVVFLFFSFFFLPGGEVFMQLEKEGIFMEDTAW